jgi:hypothetical protein
MLHLHLAQSYEDLGHGRTLLITGLVRLAGGWCWFVVREKYCWLVAGDRCWNNVREKHGWLKPASRTRRSLNYDETLSSSKRVLLLLFAYCFLNNLIPWNSILLCLYKIAELDFSETSYGVSTMANWGDRVAIAREGFAWCLLCIDPLGCSH